MTDDDDDFFGELIDDTPDTTFDRAARDALLEEYVELLRVNAGKGPAGELSWEARRPITSRLSTLRSTYLARLPRVAMSRCPLCGAELRHTFDPWGFDGLWWEGYGGRHERIAAACEHLRLLRGAVRIGGPIRSRPWAPWDRAVARLGGDAPHVLPRIMGLLGPGGVIAVVSSIDMDDGHRAFPIAYYSADTPAEGTLNAGWTEETYGFGGSWTIVHDTWDLAIREWIDRGQVQWIDPGDRSLRLRAGPADEYPYPGPAGAGVVQEVEDGALRAFAPPRGDETSEPFE